MPRSRTQKPIPIADASFQSVHRTRAGKPFYNCSPMWAFEPLSPRMPGRRFRLLTSDLPVRIWFGYGRVWKIEFRFEAKRMPSHPGGAKFHLPDPDTSGTHPAARRCGHSDSFFRASASLKTNPRTLFSQQRNVQTIETRIPGSNLSRGCRVESTAAKSFATTETECDFWNCWQQQFDSAIWTFTVTP